MHYDVSHPERKITYVSRVSRSLSSRYILECFQKKWPPVFRPETRQNNNLGSGFDSIKTGKTLDPVTDNSLGSFELKDKRFRLNGV